MKTEASFRVALDTLHALEFFNIEKEVQSSRGRADLIIYYPSKEKPSRIFIFEYKYDKFPPKSTVRQKNGTLKKYLAPNVPAASQVKKSIAKKPKSLMTATAIAQIIKMAYFQPCINILLL